MRIYRKLIISWLVLLASVSHAGWTPPVRISDEATAYSPRIVANGDMVHVVYWTSQDRPYYSRSTDNGNNWEEPFCLMDTDTSATGVSPVIRSEGGHIFVVWYNRFRNSDRVNWGFRQSTDGGREWQDISYILPADNSMLQKHTFSIAGGAIYLVYSRWAQQIIVEFTKSTDWGQTWTEPMELFRTEQTGRFDMAAMGDTIHVVWVGRFDYEHRWEIYHIRSTDSGESWSDNTLLSTADDRGSNFPTISINSAGNIAICWMDYKYSDYLWTGDLFIRYSLDSGENWSHEEQLTFTHGAFANHILWEGDSIHVTWEDWRYSQRDIFYMLSTDNGISWRDEIRVDNEPASSGDPDIAVVGEDRYLVWYDRRSDPGYGIYFSKWEEEVGIGDFENNSSSANYGMKAHPNPFNSKVLLSLELEKGGETKIEIFDICGRLVESLCKGGKLDRGKHNFTWDATDAAGKAVSSGLYFAVASTPQGKITKILTLIR